MGPTITIGQKALRRIVLTDYAKGPFDLLRFGPGWTIIHTYHGATGTGAQPLGG